MIAIEHKVITTDWSPTQIRGELDHDERYKGRLPDVRTFQTIAKQLRPPVDEGGLWHLADAKGDEAELILPVLAAAPRLKQVSMDDIVYIGVGADTTGELLEEFATGYPYQVRRIPRLSKAQSDWIIRVRRATPDLRPLKVVYDVACFYVSYEAREEQSASLDALLAFAPWRGPAAWERYQTAVAQGWAKRAAFPWTLVSDYRGGLKSMGFSPAAVDAAQTYEDLLERERQGGVEP